MKYIERLRQWTAEARERNLPPPPPKLTPDQELALTWRELTDEMAKAACEGQYYIHYTRDIPAEYADQVHEGMANSLSEDDFCFSVKTSSLCDRLHADPTKKRLVVDISWVTKGHCLRCGKEHP